MIYFLSKAIETSIIRAIAIFHHQSLIVLYKDNLGHLSVLSTIYKKSKCFHNFAFYLEMIVFSDALLFIFCAPFLITHDCDMISNHQNLYFCQSKFLDDAGPPINCVLII